MLDTLDPDFEKIYSERKDLNFCCIECADTGFQLGKEYNRNKKYCLTTEELREELERINAVEKENEALRESDAKLRDLIDIFLKNTELSNSTRLIVELALEKLKYGGKDGKK